MHWRERLNGVERNIFSRIELSEEKKSLKKIFLESINEIKKANSHCYLIMIHVAISLWFTLQNLIMIHQMSICPYNKDCHLKTDFR